MGWNDHVDLGPEMSTKLCGRCGDALLAEEVEDGDDEPQLCGYCRNMLDKEDREEPQHG